MEPRFDRPRSARRREKLEQRQASVVAVLATLAHAGHGDEREAIAAFEAATNRLGWAVLPCPGRKTIGLDALDEALHVLDGLRMHERQRLLDACIASIGHDGSMSLEETLLLRAIADSLDCPMPPIAA